MPHRWIDFVRAVSCLVAVGIAAGVASAQMGSFGVASLQGTYAFVEVRSDAGEAVPSQVTGGMLYYDGDGSARLATMLSNVPGEPDDEGNPTRAVERSVLDPDTWFVTPASIGSVEVRPYGGFVVTFRPGGDAEFGWEGLPTKTIMVDGQAVIVEYILVLQSSTATERSLNVFQHSRIAEGDLLPEAPDRE